MPKPVLFIPGLPGSHLLDEATGERLFLEVPESFESSRVERLQGPGILNASDGVVAGAPVAEIDLNGPHSPLAFFVDLKRAASLYDILRPLYPTGSFSNSCTRFGWDWRRPVWSPLTQDRLATAILDLHERRGPVVVLAHSTGGLVLRSLLEDDTHPQHDEVISAIDHVLAFGVPWAGTLKTFEVLTGERGLSGLLSPAKAREVLGRSWAAFDLLPPEPDEETPALVIDRTVDPPRPFSPLIDRRWFPKGSVHAALRTAMSQRADGTLAGCGQPDTEIALEPRPFGITNVVGWGFETAVLAAMVSDGEGVAVQFVRDPAEAGLDATDDGDGTVPRRSAAWLEGERVSTFHLPIGRGRGGVQKHITLWSNPGGRNLIRNAVAGAPFEPFVYATVDKGDSAAPNPRVRVRCAANQADGSLLDQARVRLTDPAGPEIPFVPELAGRLLIDLPRETLRPVSSQLRRLALEILWRQGAVSRSESFGFFVAR